MVDDREAAVLKAQLAAVHSTEAVNTDKKKSRNYIVHAHVMDECYMPIDEPQPPTEPEGGESVDARLRRIEERLERVIAMLEQRGT